MVEEVRNEGCEVLLSYKIHESYCLDSAQDRLLFYDDFLGDSLRDLWSTTTAGAGVGGTAVVVDAQDGGVVRLSTTATDGNEIRIDWGDYRSLHVDKNVTIEVRAKMNDTTDVYYYIGLAFDSNTSVIFYLANAGNWQNWTRNGGAITTSNTGVAVDTDYHIFRIECFPTGEVHYYIDGVETANSPHTTNIPSDAADYLQPWFRILTSEDDTQSMDIDYVVIRQDR